MKNQVYNPYLPEGEYIPDGEPHVFGDRVYIYGSHDKAGSPRYCPGDYVVWSAPVDNLSDWSNKEVSYSRRGYRNIFGFRCLWAPDCCKGSDGRYYLYYCFDFDNRILVAVSEKPDGPFEYYGTVAYPDGTLYGSGKNDIMCFDPGVLCDDDGEVYLYSGYSANEDNRKMLQSRGIMNCDGTGNQVIRLEKDMKTVKGEPRMLIPGYKNSAGTGFEGHEMYEASSIRKVNGRYYFLYSSRLSHELCYAISDKPDRDFKYGGCIVSNGDIGLNGRKTEDAVNYWGNIHGSIEKIGERWYVFYHRQTNKNEQSRQGCAEPIEIMPDGSIPQVEITSQGLNCKPLKGEGTYPSYIACALRSKNGAVKCAYGPFKRRQYDEHPFIGPYEKGKQCVRGMRNGATAGYKYFDFKGKTIISVCCRGGSGIIEIRSELDGDVKGTIPLRECKAWSDSSAEINMPEGKNGLYFTYVGAGKIDLKCFTLK